MSTKHRGFTITIQSGTDNDLNFKYRYRITKLHPSLTDIPGDLKHDHEADALAEAEHHIDTVILRGK